MKRVLVCGTGPVGIQMALLLKKYVKSTIGFVGRESIRSVSFFNAMREDDRQIHVEIQNEIHRPLEGRCTVDRVFQGYAAAYGEWDTFLMAVTTDSYIEVLNQLDGQILRHAKCILLISPTFGSNNLVKQYMKERGLSPEVISFSTYLGDTRWLHGTPSNHVKTTGVKKKLAAGSSHPNSGNLASLRDLYGKIGIALEVMSSPIEAEARNISLYVHPPLFMNAFSLSVIFKEVDSKKYVYKLFPEGPITPQLIREMRGYWQEITAIMEKLKLNGLNLLKFMSDDNYPVRPESLSRHDIENFTRFPVIQQEYLLYVRYASLLIDPFSHPDPEGKYFDFSAVPLRPIYLNHEGAWEIPRMPKEDFYRIKIIQEIARFLKTKTPTLDRFIATYESKVEETAQKLKGHPLSKAFLVPSFKEDALRICEDLVN